MSKKISIYIPPQRSVVYDINDDTQVELVLAHNKSQNININLNGRRANCKLLGLCCRRQEINITVTHWGKKTSSDIIIHSIVNKEIILKGLVIIKRGAKGTLAKMEFRSLLLSPQARVKSMPSFEIEEKDVKATHAATISWPIEEEIFYLQSRGLNQYDANRLIVKGFAQSIIDQINDQKVKEMIKYP